MAEPAVIYQRHGHIGHIILNSSITNNAIDDSMAIEFRDTCHRVIEDDEANVVIIAGSGSSFCCGTAPFGPLAATQLQSQL